MASGKTKDLKKLVENRAAEANTCNEVQQLISQGADIKEPTKNGSMIDSVIAEASRYQRAGTQWKAQNCQKLIQILQNRAFDLLANSVLSSDGGNRAEMTQLLRLHASCYQTEKYGPLGLLGELLKQDKIPIRLEVVQFLIESDQDAKFGLIKINDQQQTCLSLSKNNPKCSKDIRNYIQNTFDMILNQVPYTHPQIDVNEVAEWIRRGANPEAVDEHRNTVLSNAVRTNNLELVRVLVNVGCNTIHVNNDKLTPVQIAKNATPRNAQLVAVLEAQNINTELKRLIETRKSLLTFDEVNSLLDKGASINAPIANKSTLLHLLIANDGTPEMITAFVNDFNADISSMDINGYRPVESCILLDKSSFIRLQTCLNLSKVSTGTFFNTQLNKSILQFAKEQNRPEAVKIIQDVLNFRLWNVIIHADNKDEHNQKLFFELNQLIEYGAQIEHKHIDKEYEQWTILHLACKTMTKLFVQYLIEQFQANYLVPNGNGDYPISIAAEYGHLSIVQYLHGLPNVQLNVSNKEKQTPLHLATKNHHLFVVRYLVLWGADYQTENITKQTPLDIARGNTSKNKKDDMTDKTLIHFLQQLICPTNDKTDPPTKPNYDLDTCELVSPVNVDPIQITSVGDEERLGAQSKGFFSDKADDKLLKAAKEGLLYLAKEAIGEGANICYRKNNRTAYDIAQQSITEYHNQCIANQARLLDLQRYQEKLIGCQQIAEDIRQIAYNKLQQGIEQSQAYHVVAYYQAGAPLTGDLLYYSCTKSDNVQIVDYLINNDANIHQAMFDYSTDDSPYRAAKKNKFNNVASYLKYRLSVECTRAIQRNDIEYVRKLVRAGASVDMHNTNNLQVALEHKNAELIQLLCEKGAKLPVEWLQSKTITLPENIAKTMASDVVFRINRALINRRLRIAAACGDHTTVIKCQHLGADINSENCYGATALLCSIQHGNYFSIVHALVSHGATMLHSNDNALMSLIDLAKKHNYTQIANYLSQELNAQFLTTILNNDRKSAEKFEALGADFNYLDEQKRTPLHYAVQYHGIELVSWLCVRGCMPTIPDINGNYPLTEATEKGDYAVVELFATKYPATKQQKNKAGLTALQIAQKEGFKRIAYVLETGKPAPDTMDDVGPKLDGPKHTKEELIQAAKNGRLKIIKEFIDDRYESRDDKRKLCFELVGVAKEAKQHEVMGILQPYYNKQLKAELPSDMEMGGGIRLNQHYKKILLGFLVGLGRIIAESPVVLDPADPSTYKDLFSNLTSNQKKRSQEIQKVGSERDATKLSEQDMTNIDEKLAKIDEQLNQLNTEKETLEKDMQETTENLKQQKKEMSAMQRRDLLDQQEEHKKQLAVYECSIFLYELQQEATMNRRNTVNFIRKNTNMYLFFRTVENILQALFHGALAARSGMLTTETTSKYGTASAVIDKLPTSILPFSEVIVGAVTSAVTGILSKLDEKQQKKEYYNISTLGSIEELGRVASDTASLVTLYYKEQIQSIDTLKKIKGSNIFNDKIKWLKDVLIDVRPEDNEDMPVVIVAEYITAWIIDTLKKGKKELDPEKPLPQQLWLAVAKTNCVEQGKVTAVSDILGSTAGRQTIPLKTKNKKHEQISVHVQLRYLIGCVSIVANDGEIYQYPVSQDSTNTDLEDLEIFGYVYVALFSNNDKKSVDSIIAERKLTKAHRNASDDILTNVKEIEQYVKNFQNQDNHARQSAITAETARQIAQVLRENKSFVDPKDVEASLKKSRQDIEVSIDVLREDIQNKTNYYQTSIDSTSEKLQKDVAQAHEALKKDNEERYNHALKKIHEQLKEMQVHLENQLTQRMNTIENQLKLECDEMRKIVEAAKLDSNQALLQANQAASASKQSADRSEKASEHAKKLVESTEQRRQEFQTAIEKCDANVKQSISEQNQFCEQTITAIRTKVQQDFERTKQAAEQAAVKANQAAQAAKDSANAAQETQKDNRRQLDLQKEETDRIKSEAKEVAKQSERSANEAKEASKQAKQGADATASALQKVADMHEKMEKALQRLEKLAKKLEP